MTSTLARTALLTILAAAVWAVLFVSDRPPASAPDTASGAAVTALASGSPHEAARTVPADFADDLGYTPRTEDGRLVNPTGSCSSPVSLPAEFDGPCREHDLGYDLLRHAAHRGGTLPPSARQELDAHLVASATASCDAREGLSRTWCRSWAGIAGFFVRANSVRQHESVPDPETATSVAALGAGSLALLGSGGVLVGVGARVRRVLPVSALREVALRVPAPRVSGAAAAALGFVLSISPAHLPHSAVLQGALTAVLVGAVAWVARLLRPAAARLDGRARSWGLLLVAAGAATTLVWAQVALSERRVGVGLAPTGPGYWLTVAAVVGGSWLAVRSLRWVWSRRRVAWRPAAVLAIAATTVFSGGPVHGAPTSPEDRVLLSTSPVGAVRVYAAMREGESAPDRAERAADELVRSGGLSREHVVVAVPTGSGWINPEIVSGLEDRFGSQVATVGMQYDDAPSWVSYLLRRERAEDGARAVFDAVTARVDALPAKDRPQVHVVGESLGATAGQAIFDGQGSPRAGRVCSVLWTGTPGGHRTALPREATVANADDPVVHASPRSLLLPPGDGRTWVPVVSALHDAADFVGALEVPDGTGHRYGASPADRLATCD